MYMGPGPGGPGPPLELGIYRVKFLKIHKISFFLLLGPPLGKNRSSTPAHEYDFFSTQTLNILFFQSAISLLSYVKCKAWSYQFKQSTMYWPNVLRVQTSFKHFYCINNVLTDGSSNFSIVTKVSSSHSK